MVDWILYFLAYCLAGLTLKLGDDLLDKSNHPEHAWLPFLVSGLLFGFLMTVSEWDLVLFTAIIIGVLFSGKVNRKEFIIGFVAIVVVVAIIGLPEITDFLDWSTILIMLFMAAVLDEKGNDWSDKEASPTAARFFEYRFTLKVVALLLAIPWPLLLPTAIALWIFDAGYEIANKASNRFIVV
ncbi:MAG: hypothetical protein ACTSUO_02200 [Candidatus Thorarchaeota archaeon]